MSLSELNTHLSHIADFSDGIPLIVFLLLPMSKREELGVIGLYFFCNFLLKVATFFLATDQRNTIPFYHLLAIIEFALLFMYFTQLKKISINIKWSLLVFVIILNLTNTFFLQTINEFNSFSWTINTLLLIVIGIYCLYHAFKVEEVRFFEFVILSGFLIYLSGSLFTYILGSRILARELGDFFSNGWIVYSFSSISKDIIISIGLWMARTN